jgi:hypothetical protein
LTARIGYKGGYEPRGGDRADIQFGDAGLSSAHADRRRKRMAVGGDSSRRSSGIPAAAHQSPIGDRGCLLQYALFEQIGAGHPLTLTVRDPVYLLDLHGNTKKKVVAPDGSKGENVFDIRQGVAICVVVKKPKGKPKGRPQ